MYDVLLGVLCDVFLGVLLTMLSLMRALDAVKHHDDMMKYLVELTAIDPMRSNYYADLREYQASFIDGY